MKLTPFFNASLEVGWRKTFTDYLDDVSTDYIDNATIPSSIGKRLADRSPEKNLPPFPAGAERGNPSRKDAYMLLSGKLEYYLPIPFREKRKLTHVQRRVPPR